MKPYASLRSLFPPFLFFAAKRINRELDFNRNVTNSKRFSMENCDLPMRIETRLTLSHWIIISFESTIHRFTIFLPRRNILPLRLFPSGYLGTIRSFDNNVALIKQCAPRFTLCANNRHFSAPTREHPSFDDSLPLSFDLSRSIEATFDSAKSNLSRYANHIDLGLLDLH